MQIQTENDVKVALRSWEKMSLNAQEMRISKAIEKLELNLMYYDQKGSQKSVKRTKKCIELLNDYQLSITK